MKLAAELSRPDTGRTLYLLDEPTTGLHFDDLAKLLEVLNRLVDLGNTVLVIEHNLDVIKTADWVIDLGPEAGEEGGYLVAAGTPEDLVANSEFGSRNSEGLRPVGRASKKRSNARNRDAALPNSDFRIPNSLPSHTAVALAPVLAAGPFVPRAVYDFAAAEAARPQDRDIDEIGTAAKMPWQADGRAWHTVARVGRTGHPCRWDGRILADVVDRIEQASNLFSSTDWDSRSVVEIRAAKKSDGWFFHAIQAFLGNACQQRLLRLDKLDDPLGQERGFQPLHVDEPIDLPHHFFRGEDIDAAREGPPAVGHRVVGGGWVGLDVAAGEGLDVLPRRLAGLLRARAGEDDLLLQRRGPLGPKRLVLRPDPLGVEDAHLALGSGRKPRDRFLRIHVESRNKDAIDTLEAVPVAAARAPRQMASRAARYCRDVKSRVTFSLTPAAAKGSRASSPAGVAGTLIKRFFWPADHSWPNSIYRDTRLRTREVHVGVLQERIHFKTDVAVVATGLLPDGQKDLLGGANEVIGQLPGDLLVRQAIVDRADDEVVIPPAGNKVGHDDGIGGGPGGADGPVRAAPSRDRPSRARAWCRLRLRIGVGSWSTERGGSRGLFGIGWRRGRWLASGRRRCRDLALVGPRQLFAFGGGDGILPPLDCGICWKSESCYPLEWLRTG